MHYESVCLEKIHVNLCIVESTGVRFSENYLPQNVKSRVKLLHLFLGLWFKKKKFIKTHS
jgi:hypothetical protein